MDEQTNIQSGQTSGDDLGLQLAAARLDAEKNLNGWKRSEADFQNYQKRKEAENKELIDFAREVTVTRLLPALDTLEQALRHAPSLEARGGRWEVGERRSSLPGEERLGEVIESDDNITQPTTTTPSQPRQGFVGQAYPHSSMGETASFPQQYQTWLTGIDGLVKQLDKVLEELGVSKIEAVGKKFDPYFHEAVREVPGEAEGMVVEEYQTGFTLNGKVIRPSQVAIGKEKI